MPHLALEAATLHTHIGKLFILFQAHAPVYYGIPTLLLKSLLRAFAHPFLFHTGNFKHLNFGMEDKHNSTCNHPYDKLDRIELKT